MSTIEPKGDLTTLGAATRLQRPARPLAFPFRSCSESASLSNTLEVLKAKIAVAGSECREQGRLGKGEKNLRARSSLRRSSKEGKGERGTLPASYANA